MNKKNAPASNPVKQVVCGQFGNRCSICGSFFEEEVCSNGHIIGHRYTIPVPASTKKASKKVK